MVGTVYEGGGGAWGPIVRCRMEAAFYDERERWAQSKNAHTMNNDLMAHVTLLCGQLMGLLERGRKTKSRAREERKGGRGNATASQPHASGVLIRPAFLPCSPRGGHDTTQSSGRRHAHLAF
jgi:hypothetical protein